MQKSIITLSIVALLASGLAARAEEEAKPVKTVKYTDDFSDPKKVEADSETVNNLKVYPGYGLSSANGNNGFAIWDLQKLFPNAAAGAKATLVYDGMANPPDTRGVTWAVSTDAANWKDISKNEYNKPVEFSGRYLRASINWFQAAGPDYGSLKQFSVKIIAK